MEPAPDAALAGAAPRSERDERLYASVVTLLLLLDSAADLQLWQLLSEADAARAVHQIHLQFPEAPAAPLRRLLEGEQTLSRPLGRAAASFVHAMGEYEQTHQATHPLRTGSMRGV